MYGKLLLSFIYLSRRKCWEWMGENCRTFSSSRYDAISGLPAAQQSTVFEKVHIVCELYGFYSLLILGLCYVQHCCTLHSNCSSTGNQPGVLEYDIIIQSHFFRTGVQLMDLQKLYSTYRKHLVCVCVLCSVK